MPRKTKHPRYTVVYSEVPEPVKQKIEPVKENVTVSVKPMSIEKLISKYKGEEEEEYLPGFRYLKKMKNEIKKEHITRVLKKYQ
jgi:hypothetical protein